MRDGEESVGYKFFYPKNNLVMFDLQIASIKNSLNIIFELIFGKILYKKSKEEEL